MIKETIVSPTNLAGYDPERTAGDCWFDADAALRVINFFPTYLQHIKGPLANQPFRLNPWERDAVATMFGWKRADGTRRYREVFIAVARKNDKTNLCSGIALYGLTSDGESGADIFCCAGDRDQATLVFQPAASNVRRNQSLAARCKVKQVEKRIVFNNDCVLRAIPADAAGAHGYNAHMAIMDEFHTQPNRDLYEVMKTSMGTRTQPMMISITTAGHDKESICYEVWDYARKVRDGIVDDPYFLPIIYEPGDKDDWTKEATWKRANPNYGRSVSKNYLQEAFQRAKTTPAFENTFKNLHLNMWTDSAAVWLSSDQWNSCTGEIPDLRGCPAFAGLDLASVGDLTALVFVVAKADKFYVIPHFFCPEETVIRGTKRYQGQYQEWAREGLLTVTPGYSTDYNFIREKIAEVGQQFDLKHVGYDPWQAQDTITELMSAGVSCVKFPQTVAGLWPGTKAVEECVLNKSIVHSGNAMMDWMVSSTVVELDACGNRKPSKKKSHGVGDTKGKIDGVIAMVMAMSLAFHSDVQVSTFYETHELEVG